MNQAEEPIKEIRGVSMEGFSIRTEVYVVIKQGITHRDVLGIYLTLVPAMNLADKCYEFEAAHEGYTPPDREGMPYHTFEVYKMGLGASCDVACEVGIGLTDNLSHQKVMYSRKGFGA